jgi:predicted nucleic-acid-binding protein
MFEKKKSFERFLVKAANAELEREVERYQQRQALLEKVHVLKQKLAWMRVAVKNEEKEELNEALKKQFEMVVQLKESLSSAAELTKAEKNVDACKAGEDNEFAF